MTPSYAGKTYRRPVAVDSPRPVPGRSALFVLRLMPLLITLVFLVLSLLNKPAPMWHWVLGLLTSALPLVDRGRPLLGIIVLNVVLTVARVRGVNVDLLVMLPVTVWLVDLVVEQRGRRLVVGVLAGVATMAASLLNGQFDAEAPRVWFAIAVFLACAAGIPVLIGLNLRSARLAAQQAEDRAEEVERRRASETKAARAEERAAIARELHDLVAHHVASIVLRVGVARHVVGGRDPAVTEVLDDVHATGSAVLGDLRRLVAVLRDPTTAGADNAPLLHPADLPDSLEDTIARSRQAGLTVVSSMDPATAELDAVRGLTVLRVVQEGLTNVLKHAGPGASATVRVAAEEDEVLVEVSDDGAGSRPQFAESGGHGLLGLRERVDLVGGTLDAGPAESGWRVVALLPSAIEPGGSVR